MSWFRGVRKRRVFLAVWCWVSASACGGAEESDVVACPNCVSAPQPAAAVGIPHSAAPARDGAKEPHAALCPSCVPVLGSGAASITDCHYEIHDTTADERKQLSLESLEARFSAPFEAELEWEMPAADGGDPVRLTRSIVDARISLGSFQVFTSSDLCGRYASAPATAVWSTRDGALEAETHGELQLDPQDLSWSIDSEVGLEQTRGSLHVPIDTARPHTGKLYTRVVPDSKHPGQLAGYLAIQLAYFDDQAALDRAISGSDTAFISIQTVVAGRFPPLGPPVKCTPGEMSVPNSADDPCPQTGTACSRAGLLASAKCEPTGRYPTVCECLEH